VGRPGSWGASCRPPAGSCRWHRRREPRQVAYIRDLCAATGTEFSEPKDKAQASRAIKSLLKKPRLIKAAPVELAPLLKDLSQRKRAGAAWVSVTVAPDGSLTIQDAEAPAPDGPADAELAQAA
jgi:hypothetical protein